MKKTSFPFIHLIALLLTPMIFACAHATTEETLDGYGGTVNITPAVERTDAPELVDPLLTAEPTQKQVAATQKPVVKSKAIKHAVQAPKRVVAAAPVVKQTVAAVEPPALVESPNTTVTRNGSTLNRYYFLRTGDTPELLSRIFYGDPNRAAEIVEWNGPASDWETGKVVYYRSGTNPDDQTLVSYYFEAGVPTQEVALGADENLMTLAQKHFGSADSWREIAVLNGLRKGAGPEAGAFLKLYPSTFFKDAPATPVVAQMDPKVVKEKKSKWANAQIASFIQHNPLIVACTLVAFVLLGAFLFMQRKRYRSKFDF